LTFLAVSVWIYALADLPTLVILVQSLPREHGFGAQKAAADLVFEIRGGYGGFRR